MCSVLTRPFPNSDIILRYYILLLMVKNKFYYLYGQSKNLNKFVEISHIMTTLKYVFANHLISFKKNTREYKSFRFPCAHNLIMQKNILFRIIYTYIGKKKINFKNK